MTLPLLVRQPPFGRLACSTCDQALGHFTETAYGFRAECGCPDVRWTAIREHEAIAPEWVPEKRHPMSAARTPKQATESLDIIVVTDERVPLGKVHITSRPRCRHVGGSADCDHLCVNLYGGRFTQT